MAKKRIRLLTNVSVKPKMPLVSHSEIKRRRERMGLSQVEAAKRAGFKSAIQWWDVENKTNDPQVSTLVKVAKVLGCKVDQLLVK